MTERMSEDERRRGLMVHRSRQLLAGGLIVMVGGCAVIAFRSDPFGPIGLMTEMVGGVLLTATAIGVLLMPMCSITLLGMGLVEWWMRLSAKRFRPERVYPAVAYAVPAVFAVGVFLIAENTLQRARSLMEFIEVFAFPGWFCVSLSLMYAGAVHWIGSTMIVLHDPGRCLACGYDLSGLAGVERCPECGERR